MAPMVELSRPTSNGVTAMVLKGIWSLSCLVICAIGSNVAVAKERLSIALNVDPAFTAMMYGITKGKVSSDLVDLDIHLLDVNALAQAASSNRFDILQVTAQAVPRAATQGLPMKVIGISVANPDGPGRDIWVKKDSPLRKPEDLKGKTLGIYSLASGAVTLVRIALSKHFGFNVAANGGDFVMKQMQIMAMPAALATGQVDASMLSNVLGYRAGKSGDFRSLVNIDRINIGLFGSPAVSTVFIGYTDRLQGKPEIYRAALQLLIKSRDYARTHPDEVFPTVAAEHNVDEEYLRIWEQKYQAFPVSVSSKDADNLDKLWMWSKELGILPEIVPAASVIWDGALRQ
jgi:NitT/TauT family transport system substrate-binding protein